RCDTIPDLYTYSLSGAVTCPWASMIIVRSSFARGDYIERTAYTGERTEMLDRAKNQLLTQVGRATPMGQLLRRYWMPIAAVSEFDRISIRPVRIFGEDLTLYKDLTGSFGLIDRHCPHRRADLSSGFVEQCGLRCNYHGWLFDEKG